MTQMVQQACSAFTTAGIMISMAIVFGAGVISATVLIVGVLRE